MSIIDPSLEGSLNEALDPGHDYHCEDEDKAKLLVHMYNTNEIKELSELHDKLEPLFATKKDAVEWLYDYTRVDESLNEKEVIDSDLIDHNLKEEYYVEVDEDGIPLEEIGSNEIEYEDGDDSWRETYKNIDKDITYSHILDWGENVEKKFGDKLRALKGDDPISLAINESLNEEKKTYKCDDCGYEVELDDKEYTGQCPNCGEHHGFYELDENLAEDLKVISDFSEYSPWSGAVDTYNKIEEAGLLNELESALEDMYPEGINQTDLNDLLWFESDYILDMLGIAPGDDEEFEESLVEEDTETWPWGDPSYTGKQKIEA